MTDSQYQQKIKKITLNILLSVTLFIATLLSVLFANENITIILFTFFAVILIHTIKYLYFFAKQISKEGKDNEENLKQNYNYTDLLYAYNIFNLNGSENIDQIKKKFRELINIWHPDRFSNDSKENKEIAKKNTQKILKAYTILKNLKNFK